MKYSARGCSATSDPMPKKPGHDFLREALRNTLQSGDACMEFYLNEQNGRLNPVFARLPLHAGDKESADGVSCSICHRITPQNLGTAGSFNGNFIVNPPAADGAVVGSLPEQRSYQEWLHGDFRNERTYQSCHTPAVNDQVPIARIL